MEAGLARISTRHLVVVRWRTHSCVPRRHSPETHLQVVNSICRHSRRVSGPQDARSRVGCSCRRPAAGAMMDFMVPGAPAEARWVRSAPRLDWPLPLVEHMARTAFPRQRVRECRPLSNGLRNANLLLTLDSVAEPLVLRIYQHDPSLCQKEVDLMRLVRPTVPVPEVIHASPRGWEELPPFALLQFVEGISLLDLKRRGDLEAFAQAAFSAGERS